MIEAAEFAPADPKDGSKGYRFSSELTRAVRVALATERPLLLRGEPGVGKSRLAEAVAKELRAEFYSEVMTSMTEARDLQWSFDTMQRLCDAQAGERLAGKVAELKNYVKPRALWWAFDPEQAARPGSAIAPPQHPDARNDRAVMLVDEIDKAEPQVANDLLEPFDGRGFTVAETGQAVAKRRDVVLIVTTNAEKDLPAAFLRRCIVFRVALPGVESLTRIGRVHFSTEEAPPELLQRLAELTIKLQKEAADRKLRAPATAEFLDAVKAASKLEPSEAEWETVARLALWKHDGGVDRSTLA